MYDERQVEADASVVSHVSWIWVDDLWPSGSRSEKSRVLLKVDVSVFSLFL